MSLIVIIHIVYWTPPLSSGSVLDHRSLLPVFESQRGLKVVSSLTSPHYPWRSLGPFSLPCAKVTIKHQFQSDMKDFTLMWMIVVDHLYWNTTFL